MTRTSPRAFQLGSTVVVFVLLSIAALLAYINHDLKRALASYEGMHLLSPDTCKEIAGDLNSSDPARLERWKTYFRRVADGKSDAKDGNLPIRDVVDIYYRQYLTTEQPARSNRFCQLLSALMSEQDSEGLKVQDLAHYLGQADTTSNGPGTNKSLRYRFDRTGTNAVVIVETRGDQVVGFDFEVDPR
jgi:hypothetical protein